MNQSWIADRMSKIDASGIRKKFEMAEKMKNPINLGIGEPHFQTPEIIKNAICDAVQAGNNCYTPSQGIAPLRQKFQSEIDAKYGHTDREVFISSGSSGGLLLSLMTLVNPGDEVVLFDPYFVMYQHLVTLAGGKSVFIDTYPHFRIDLEQVRSAITDKTKVILVNSPGNPTGAVATEDEMRGLAELAAEKNVALVSDEIYDSFCYDKDFHTPTCWNEKTIVVNGFSKSYSMTGLRLGYVHGPSELIQEMIKLQQFTFVCAPHPVQWGAMASWECDISDRVQEYRSNRDFLIESLGDVFEIEGGEGAFYMFLKSPKGTASEFAERCIEQKLVCIPGNVFSRYDTHFRISYATDRTTLERGVEVLQKLANG